MEYEIYAETLVRYALRDTNTNEYICYRDGRGNYLGGLSAVVTYDTVQDALNKSEKFSSMFNTKFEVRKIKTVDIGEYPIRNNP